MKITNLIWPYVGPMPSDETLTSDLKSIEDASWGSKSATFLDEARRLRDIETYRKNAAETKSQIYLAALLALIPILVSLTEHSALKGILDFSFWYQTLGFIFFVLSIVYGIGAFVSSFQALSVGAYHRVDIKEIVDSGTQKDGLEHLAKEILKTVRKDRSSINHKISFVIVTHKLVFRMFFALLLALSLIIVSPAVEKAIGAAMKAICN